MSDSLHQERCNIGHDPMISAQRLFDPPIFSRKDRKELRWTGRSVSSDVEGTDRCRLHIQTIVARASGVKPAGV
jgi:hypothetical protein